MRIKLLVITHGEFGLQLYNAARDIMGKVEDVEVYGIYRTQSVQQIKDDLKNLIDIFLKDSAVLILTDMLGGTPTNMVLEFLNNNKVEVITGINLPMFIVALNKKKQVEDVKKFTEIVCEETKKSIVNCRNAIM